jgi:hypothetical protein
MACIVGVQCFNMTILDAGQLAPPEILSEIDHARVDAALPMLRALDTSTSIVSGNLPAGNGIFPVTEVTADQVVFASIGSHRLNSCDPRGTLLGSWTVDAGQLHARLMGRPYPGTNIRYEVIVKDNEGKWHDANMTEGHQVADIIDVVSHNVEAPSEPAKTKLLALPKQR